MARGTFNGPSAAALLAACVWLTAWSAPAEEPADESPPPHPGALLGEDAAAAARLETQLAFGESLGAYRQAAAVAEQLVALRTDRQGAMHWETRTAAWALRAVAALADQTPEAVADYRSAGALLVEAEALDAGGDYARAQPLLERALEIYRRLGEDHRHTAAAANNLAANLYLQGRYDEAQRLFEATLETTRRALGEDHPDTATCYNNLATNLSALARHDEAMTFTEKALDIRRRVLGEDHFDTGTSYNNVGMAWQDRGRYDEAQPHLERAFAVLVAAAGEDHPDALTACNNLASNLDYLGRYAESQEMHQRALAGRRRVHGDDHPETAISLTNLGSCLNHQGQYVAAQALYARALEIRRRALGEDHPDTAHSFNNVATNLDDQGQHAEARPLYERALSIRQSVLGEDHPDTAQAYNNLASNLADSGHREAAQPLYEHALDIWRRSLGDHPATSLGCTNVAFNLGELGRPADAFPQFQEALAIQRRLLGEDHPETARCLNNLAYNLAAQGRYAEALPYVEQAADVYRRRLGESHPYTAQLLGNVAENLCAQGEWRRAWDSYQSAATAFAAARGAAAFGGTNRVAWSARYSPLAAMARVAARLGLAEEAWKALEEDLGRGLWDEIALRREGALSPEDRDAWRQAESDLRSLDQLLSSALDEAARAAVVDQRLAAAQRLSEIQARLMETLGPAVEAAAHHQAVQTVLDEDEALLAWLDVPPPGPGAADADGDHWAVVLRRTGPPQWVDLPGTGESGAWTTEDEQLCDRLREVLEAPDDDEEWRSLAARLRRQRIAPLVGLAATDDLPAVRRIIVLPSRAMAAIPLDALRGPEDRWTVSYAPSATVFAWLRGQRRDADERPAGLLTVADPVFREAVEVAPEPERPLPPHGLLIDDVLDGSNAETAGIEVGDVLLSYDGSELHAVGDLKVVMDDDSGARIAVEVWRNGERLVRHAAPGRLGVGMAPRPAPVALAERRAADAALRAASAAGAHSALPGTAWEAANLARRFRDAGLPERSLLGLEASESALHELADADGLAAYRFIHLATHAELDDRFPQRSAVALCDVDLADPLQAMLAGRPPIDGRLTVAEIRADWRLRADLVTLSACRSGRGREEGGEGFVGFTQALLSAGARSVCLSLWDVDDTATALLMDRFYANLLALPSDRDESTDKAEALAEAQRWLRSRTAEEAAALTASLSQGVVRGAGHKTTVVDLAPPPADDPTAHPYEHPYFWAGFVLIGDPR